MIKIRPIFAVLALGVALVLSGCGARDPDLRKVRSTGAGPEEFGIVPNKPLEIPSDLAALPTPVDGGQNRTAQTPIDDAIVALGGSPARAGTGGTVPTGDAALVRQAGRFGIAPDIRSVLAAEDRAFREQSSRFTWQIAPGDRYKRVYGPLSLDAFNEVARFRRAGVRTPASPPRGFAP